MKQKNFFKNLIILICLTGALFSYGQVTIYSEDFTGQNGKGATGGTPPTTDLTGVDWTIDTSSATLSSRWFKVNKSSGNEYFEGRFVDGSAVWLSPSIDISGHTNISLSLVADKQGTMESDDSLNTEYRINGGTWTSAATNGSLNDDFSSTTVSQTGLNGNTLEIRVTINNNADHERHKIDDILVQGTVLTSNPTITFDSATSAETETDATFATSGIPITLSNYTADVTVTASVNGSSTAEAGDYTIDLTPLVFNANETLTIPLSINDDATFDDETIVIDITVTNGTANLGTSTHTVTIADDDSPQIMVSEIMYKSTGNGDEWIEIYNGNGADVDVSSWEIIYGSKTFTFPASTTITDGDYITIAVGSNADGTYNNDSPFLPDFNNLIGSPSNADVKDTDDLGNLDNSSGTITIQHSNGSTVDSASYNSGDNGQTNGKGSSFEIINTTLDNSVTSANWRSSAANGGSPGRISSTVWSGATNTDWNEASNWIYGEIPVATQDISIPKDLTNYPIASNAVTVNSVTIISGASLIAQSSFSGTIISNLRVLKEKWHLVSSPVAGETYDDAYVAANSLAINGTNNAISTYAPETNTWSYMQTGGGATFTSGQGYSLRREDEKSAGNISFTGTLNTSDVETSSLAVGFNLLGNPFTSYVNSATFLGAATSSNIDQSQIWLWNGATGMYEVKTSGDAWVLSPGQGFFVNATSAGTVTFDESNQAATGDSFQKSAKTEVKLLLSDGENNRFAKLNFGGNFNKGYDFGWEGETFGGIPNSLSIFTALVNDNVGKRYQVQSLPNSDNESMVIPLGITADANKEITFSAEAINLQEGIKVFLEDRINNTFTRLDQANAAYKVTLDEKLDGVGRFYIHTTQSALSIDNVALTGVSIFKTNATALRVRGLKQGKASLSIFNVLGKQVMSTSFEASASKDIYLPKLAKGIYFVKVQTATGKLSKKIIIE